jgi:Predicted oxidoreductases (related to aryl-alcohol dehydrogenases)
VPFQPIRAVHRLNLLWRGYWPKGKDIVPIPGTKRRGYLEENIGALDLRLTAEELAEIDTLLPPGAAAGSRYSEPGMRTINR